MVVHSTWYGGREDAYWFQCHSWISLGALRKIFGKGSWSHHRPVERYVSREDLPRVELSHVGLGEVALLHDHTMPTISFLAMGFCTNPTYHLQLMRLRNPTTPCI
jgi:hypothetical protein